MHKFWSKKPLEISIEVFMLLFFCVMMVCFSTELETTVVRNINELSKQLNGLSFLRNNYIILKTFIRFAVAVILLVLFCNYVCCNKNFKFLGCKSSVKNNFIYEPKLEPANVQLENLHICSFKKMNL